MANICAFFLISFLFATSNLFVNGQQVDMPAGANVTGQLCCTTDGNCPGQGLDGVVVTLNCNIFNLTIPIGNATTSGNGDFAIVVPDLIGPLLGLSILPCYVSIPLPIADAVCPALSTDVVGMLVSQLQFVGMAFSSLINGLVGNFVLRGFSIVSP